jgi:hypothetical protein
MSWDVCALAVCLRYQGVRSVSWLQFESCVPPCFVAVLFQHSTDETEGLTSYRARPCVASSCIEFQFVVVEAQASARLSEH